MADGQIAITERWYSARELAGLPGVPGTERGVRKKADAEKWPSRPREVGKGSEWPLSALPAATQAALLLRAAPAAAPVLPARRPKEHGQPRHVHPEQRAARWAHFERLSDARKVVAQERLKAVMAVQALIDGGVGVELARHAVAAQYAAMGRRGFSTFNLSRLAAAVGDAPRADWLALLADEYVGRTARAACEGVAWEWYQTHYLTRARPSHASTYRRVVEMAATQGWRIPSAITFVRRLDAEVSHVTQVLLREGPEAASRLMPTRQRDASVFGCGEAVNGDGLKFDRLWVKFPDGEILNTATAWFWQDIYSRRILAWRLDKTENTDVFRLATYDLTAICAPDYVLLDNTRVAANKAMTAGAPGRHRFTADPEDGLGLLLMLGMNPHFTNPDKETGNPGAKPIERAFGIGGIHSEVATHPKLIGTGFSKATAIDAELLREVITQEVARFNARPKRDTQACNKLLSFDEAWQAGLQRRPPRVLSDAQRRLLLMAREVVTVQRTGIVEIKAGRSDHGRNSYWHDRTVEFAGQKVAVHFDPANLRADVHLYSLQGRYLLASQHRASAAFNDTRSAREDAKWKTAAIKARKKEAEYTQRRSKLENEQLYALSTDRGGAAATDPSQGSSTVVSAHFQKAADPARDAHRAPPDGVAEVIPLKRTGTDDLDVYNLRLNDMLIEEAKRRNEVSFWERPERDE